MDINETMTVTRFQLHRVLRDRLTWAGLLAFAVVVAIGSWLHWRSLPPRPAGARLFGEAYVIAFMLAFHCGIARDRMSRFDVYLAANFVRPKELYISYLATTCTVILVAALVGFLFNVIASLGDPEFAARYAVIFLFASFILLPVAIFIELVLNSRFPVPVLLILLSIVLTVYNRFADVKALLNAVGLSDPWETPNGIVLAVLRCIIALVLAFALYPLFRFRLGVTRLQRA